ncbi:MAG: shikimate dehydrogenase [Xanthobacteraceae bacterium]
MTEPAPAACVVGWPIGHSRSPLIHNYWLKTYRIAGEYRRESVPPEQFGSFMQSLSARGYVGANVTVPHKEAALACSQGDDRGRAVGAANTLWLDNGVLRSTNSDVEGFLNNLDACARDWHRSLTKAVVLGAGGAARAVTYALLERGIEHIAVINRTPGRAEALRQRFGERVHPLGWDGRDAALGDAGLVVNTTTLGMAAQPDLTLDIGRLPDRAIVVELVYAPLLTPLLRAARARGLRTADGLGMLMHQAVRGFTQWFGKKPEVTEELRALLEADLTAPQPKPSE